MQNVQSVETKPNTPAYLFSKTTMSNSATGNKKTRAALALSLYPLPGTDPSEPVKRCLRLPKTSRKQEMHK